MTAIDKLIQIAQKEVGYLEKKNGNNLYDKTANAGQNNYTKYWADIKPSYQGQPWCACFVTWCFVQAFGKDAAAKLLKHFPYVYCPTMASLFTLNANPKRGDIVIFKHSGTFTHTGIVTGVNGDYFTTIEGNTSGGGMIIANGGAVCSKAYYNSNLPGTKFCRPAYDEINESEGLTMTQYEELKTAIAELAKKNAAQDDIINIVGKEIAGIKAELSERTGYYNHIDENMDASYRPTIQKLVGKKLLQGNENGELRLTTDMMRILTILDRTGVFG